MALDLGSILTGLGSTYISARYGTQPAQQPLYQPALNWGQGLSSLVGPDVASGAIPPCPTGWKFNNSTGAWEKKRRRRRKRLATPSDLKDLAALKGVLGGGEAFKVWIATHS